MSKDFSIREWIEGGTEEFMLTQEVAEEIIAKGKEFIAFCAERGAPALTMVQSRMRQDGAYGLIAEGEFSNKEKLGAGMLLAQMISLGSTDLSADADTIMRAHSRKFGGERGIEQIISKLLSDVSGTKH